MFCTCVQLYAYKIISFDIKADSIFSKGALTMSPIFAIPHLQQDNCISVKLRDPIKQKFMQSNFYSSA